MVGALIDHLARGVDIMDFGDREEWHFTLRPALPNGTDAENGGSEQSQDR